MQKRVAAERKESKHISESASLSLYTTEESASTRNAIVADRLYNGQSLTRNGRTNTQISD